MHALFLTTTYLHSDRINDLQLYWSLCIMIFNLHVVFGLHKTIVRIRVLTGTSYHVCTTGGWDGCESGSTKPASSSWASVWGLIEWQCTSEFSCCSHSLSVSSQCSFLKIMKAIHDLELAIPLGVQQSFWVFSVALSVGNKSFLYLQKKIVNRLSTNVFVFSNSPNSLVVILGIGGRSVTCCWKWWTLNTHTIIFWCTCVVSS